MEKCFDENKIAKLTGTAVQDDETFKAEGGFVPERDQFYFEHSLQVIQCKIQNYICIL